MSYKKYRSAFDDKFKNSKQNDDDDFHDEDYYDEEPEENASKELSGASSENVETSKDVPKYVSTYVPKDHSKAIFRGISDAESEETLPSEGKEFKGVLEKFDDSIRPRRLEDFIGQGELRRNLRVYLDAAKKRDKAMDHLLFYGNPGLGKTTLAHIIASELGVNLVSTSGPALIRGGDLASILSNLQANDVFFIDEIHRMPMQVEEVLYPAMEDYKLDLVIGQGPAAKTVKLEVEPFTLVGATTRMGLLSSPLRDRFGIVSRLEFYTPQELCEVVLRASRIIKVEITEKGAMEIGKRSRGTPRIANRLLRRVHDFASVLGSGNIDDENAHEALCRLDVDEVGLDEMDRRILSILIQHYDGGPVGLKTLSVACSEEMRTIEEIYEPFLIQCGFLKRTPKGRVATDRAYKHMGF